MLVCRQYIYMEKQHLFPNKEMSGEDWGIGILEEGREEILEWREQRLKRQARQKSFHGFTVYSFNLKTLHSFIHNFNYMVLMHMALAGVSVYLAKRFNLSFDIQLSLLISPIVFPLAFAINADFQRRDTVLEYIAHFESSGMVLYLCMREWRKDTGLSYEWINTVHDKLKSILFLLREYLFTDEDDNRKFILRAIYEDISDTNQMIEQIRTSKLQPNGPLLSRVIHLLSLMCLAFERLRVVKEYRSPRSIRAFNKVLIMLLPLIMAPYFVFLGKKSENEWSPYFISILMAFVFSALQGVQDKLDDPFDGMGEDDIKLNAIDEWTFDSFEATVQRFNVGRFNVSVEKSISEFPDKMFIRRKSSYNVSSRKSSISPGHDLLRRESTRISSDPTSHPFHDVLENIKPIMCIKNCSGSRRRFSECDDNQNIIGINNLLKTDPIITDYKSPNREKIHTFSQNSDLLKRERKCSPSLSVTDATLEDVSFHSSENIHKFVNERLPAIIGRTNVITVEENIEDSHEHLSDTPSQKDDIDNYSTLLMNETFHFEKQIENDSSKFKEKNQNKNKTNDVKGEQNSNTDDGSTYSNEKNVNLMKKTSFRISPIHEEPEIFSDKEDKDIPLANGDCSREMFNNVAYDKGISEVNTKEKELPPMVPYHIYSSSPLENNKSVSSAITEKHPSKRFCVNSAENHTHDTTSDLHDNKIKATSIDISSPQDDIDNTSSGSLVKDKYKLLHRETDFSQSKDVHSRLS